jgi:hypothetical protein
METQRKTLRSEVRQPKDEKLRQGEALLVEGCFCGQELTELFVMFGM